jgi:hypothetical protein
MERKGCVVKEPQKGGCMPLRYLFHSIIVISGSDQPTEGRKRNSEGGYARHSESIPQSTPAINSSDRLMDEW